MTPLISKFLAHLLLMFWPQYVAAPFTTGASSAGSWTGTVLSYSVYCASSSTTCGVPSVTLAAGDAALVISTAYTNYVYVVSVSGQPCVPLNLSVNAYTTGGFQSACLILSASAVTNATVTATWSAASTGIVSIVRAHTASGTAAIDAYNSYGLSTSSSSLNAPSLTAGATNDLCVSYVGYTGSGSAAIASPYTLLSTAFSSGAGNYAALAYEVNVSSCATPNWTSLSGSSSNFVIAVGFAPSSTVPWGLMDSSGGSNGATPTAATLATSTQGFFSFGSYANAYGGLGNWSFPRSGGTTGLTYCTAAHHGLLNATPRFLYGGVTYSDSGSVGMCFATGNDVIAQLNFPGNGGDEPAGIFTSTQGSGTVDFYTTLSTSGAGGGSPYVFGVSMSSGSPTDELNMHIQNTVNPICLSPVFTNGGTGSCQNITGSTWYKLAWLMDESSALTVTAATWSSTGGGQATLTVANSFNAGEIVNLAGFTPSGWNSLASSGPAANGCNAIISATSTQIVVAMTSSPGTETGLGTVQACDRIAVLSDSGTSLIEWQSPSNGSSEPLGQFTFGQELGGLPSGSSLYFDKYAVCSPVNGPIYASSGIRCPWPIIP